MGDRTKSCAILLAGEGGWAFEPLARQLADALWVDVSSEPADFNYLLFADFPVDPTASFIPVEAIETAADKRKLASIFNDALVPTPASYLCHTFEEALLLASRQPGLEWCLKFPTGCGASGHRMLTFDTVLPKNWPFPLLVQEFVRLEDPIVYRTYAAGRDLFGWVVRRFPKGVKPSPWVAHARGARYEQAGDPPGAALDAARKALNAVGLLESFGCVDLIRKPDWTWVVLEVGTDGIYNHVDRELGDAILESELLRRVAESFWARAGLRPPWNPKPWRPRSSPTCKR